VVKEDMQKKYENLRRMPFSLYEEAGMPNSPVNNILSDEEHNNDSRSLEIELNEAAGYSMGKSNSNFKLEEDGLHFDEDSQLSQSFDIFDNDYLSPDRKNESEIHNKGNKMLDSMNVYLNLSNKACGSKEELNKYQSHMAGYNRQTTAKTRHITGENVTYSESRANAIDSSYKRFYKIPKMEMGKDQDANTNTCQKSNPHYLSCDELLQCPKTEVGNGNSPIHLSHAADGEGSLSKINRLKSFTSRKPKVYSDIDNKSINASNVTEVKPPRVL
jgi:hypothetical protein